MTRISSHHTQVGIISLHIITHNFPYDIYTIHESEPRDKKTPVERAGLCVEGVGKLKVLIQNAALYM